MRKIESVKDIFESQLNPKLTQSKSGQAPEEMTDRQNWNKLHFLRAT